MQPGPTPADDRLNGWKEIASFLGKGVRTVQRWEKEYGLPVRRLGREGGEIIWASRLELGDWMRRQSDAALAGAAIAPNNGVGTPAQPGADALPDVTAPLSDEARRRRLSVRAIVGAAIVGAAAILVSWLWPAAQPAKWKVVAGNLHVYDQADRLLWTKSFPFIRDDSYADAALAEREGRVLVRDIDGDGSTEVLFMPVSGGAEEAMGLYAYDARGSERFVLRPTHRVTFGDTLFSGPWQPYRVFLTQSAAGPSSIFVVFVHALEFPTLLLEVDPNGRPVSEYWSNGYIESVLATTWNGSPVLLVGGAHNDTWGASLAIFRNGQASGFAPAEAAQYRCVDCPGSAVTEFLVFPRRCIARAMPGKSVATVTELKLESNGRVMALVAEGPRRPDGAFNAAAWYSLGRNLDLGEVLVGSGLERAHAEFHKNGQLDHAWRPQDHRDFFPVKRWDGQRLVDLSEANARVVR